MKRITIIGLHLGYGGIENSIASFVNSMCDRYDITLVSIYKLYNKPVYNINPKVKIEYLIDSNLAIRVDKYKKLLKEHQTLKLFKAVNTDYIKKGQFIKLVKDTFNSMRTVKIKKSKTANYLKHMDTDVVISTRDFINELVSDNVSDDIIKIAWEHNYGDLEYINGIIKTCHNIDKLVLVSNNLYNIYSKEIKKYNYKLKCIYIPNVIDLIPTKVSKLNNYNIVSVGRLSKEKGYLDLIDVFKIIHDMDRRATLKIIGDGDQKPLIEEKIKKFGLEKRVNLVGYQDKKYINKVLNDSTLYLMTSFTESFGIVLVEAFAAGVPCIAFDSAEGANEIIENDKNGYLIEHRDKNAMASKAICVLRNIELQTRLGKCARETSFKYTKDEVYSKWTKIIKK